MKDRCGSCGLTGNGIYGNEPDPCMGELQIISICCGHGLEPPHVYLASRGYAVVYMAQIIEMVGPNHGGINGHLIHGPSVGITIGEA